MGRQHPHTRFASRTSPYSPKPLKGTEIRLIQLAPGRFDDLINIRLQRGTLSEKLQYEALSYTWGTETSPFQARVNGMGMWITANLDCALRHLRFETGYRTLWVDALCINQNNIRERNHQVQLMKGIYSGAREVLVWLGLVSLGHIYVINERRLGGISNFFSRSIGQFSPKDKTVAIHTASRPGLTFLDSDDWPQAFDYIKDGKIPDSLAGRTMMLHSLVDMCCRPYFKRVWVVQELAMAKNDPIMHLGKNTVLWSQLATFVDKVLESMEEAWINNSQGMVEDSENIEDDVTGHLVPNSGDVKQVSSDMPEDSDQNSWPLSTWFGCGNFDGARHVQQLQEIRKLYFQGDLDLVYCVCLSHHLCATDPRDKIYGFLGVANTPRLFVTPDYSKTVQQVFCEITATMILESFVTVYAQSLHDSYLGDESFSKKLSDLPSWVPDWSITIQDNGDSTTLHKWISSPKFNPAFYKLLHFRFFNEYTPVARFCCDYKTLYTTGMHMGTIDVTSACYLMQIRRDESGRSHYLSATSLLQFYNTVAKLKSIAPELLFSLMVGEAIPLQEVQEAADTQQSNNTYIHEGPFLREEGWFRLQPRTACYTLFMTEDGQIGEVYHPDRINGIRSGDQLVGLFGINMPFILRPGPRGYEMINMAHLPQLEKLGHEFMENATPEATWRDLEKYGMKEYVIV